MGRSLKMPYQCAFDTTIEGKHFKKGDELPNNFANYSCARWVDKITMVPILISKTLPKIEIKKPEPPKKIEKKKEGHGRPKKR
jgi:hypothetical protein